jgi:thymidylate synthase ThyX
MAYFCRVERDSIARSGHRLVSFLITFPRIVLAEAVTHRLNYDSWGPDHIYCERTTTPEISKNSASSRAIPFNKMLDKVKEDPFMPLWTQNQKGMQGSSVENPEDVVKANQFWLMARDWAVAMATQLSLLNIHKQDINRLLEPFAWVTQIVTSSNWDNFFALRCDSMAHPAIRHIARVMYLHLRKSTPMPLEYGEWHLPFVPLEEQLAFRWIPFVNNKLVEEPLPDLIKHSAARCAWVSYENHDRDGSPEAMLSTYKRLMEGDLKHSSPVEHQATPMDPGWNYGVDTSAVRSNLTGWLQARKLIPKEKTTEYNPSEEEIASWGIEI